MESYITITDTAKKFDTSKATILKWIEKGVLKEDVRLGRIKTVTRKSVEKKLSDKHFMTALRLSQKNRTKKEVRDKLIERIEVIEKFIHSSESKKETKQQLEYVLGRIEGLEQIIIQLQREIKVLKDNSQNILHLQGKYVESEEKIFPKAKVSKNTHEKIQSQAQEKTQNYSENEVLKSKLILTALEELLELDEHKRDFGYIRKLITKAKQRWLAEGKTRFYDRIGISRSILEKFTRIDNPRKKLSNESLRSIKKALEKS